ncbi:MAG: Ig-like domain-containing protein [Methylococcales bacterium]
MKLNQFTGTFKFVMFNDIPKNEISEKDRVIMLFCRYMLFLTVSYKQFGKLLVALVLVFAYSALIHAAPTLTFVGSEPKSIQFIDGNGDLWGTDDGYFNDNPVGDGARKIVKFSGTPGGSPVVYESTYTELLKPKGSNVTLGPESYSVIRDIWQLPDGNLIFSTVNGFNDKGYLYKLRVAQNKVGNNAPNFDNKQAVMNIGERNGVQPGGFRTLHQASLSMANINGATVLLFGEYNVNHSRTSGGTADWVGLWKSADLGDTWSKVIEWNTVDHQTSHIHGIRFNPYNQWFYMLFGDQDSLSEPGIVAWDGLSAAPPNNTPISQMGGYPGWKAIAGSYVVRTGDIVFTPTQCVWIPDVDEVPPGGVFGQRANHDLSGLVATGPVPYTNKIPAILGYRDSSNGNIYWSSFWTEGASEQKFYLWTSNNSGGTWDLAAKINNYSTYTAIPNSLFKAPWGQLVLSGVLGFNFQQPAPGQSPSYNGSSAFFQIGGVQANTAPIANNDGAATTQGQSVTIKILANDTDAESNISPTTVNIATQPANGCVVALADGSVKYTPVANFAGSNTFTYTLKDTLGLESNPATVTVSVAALVAVNDSYTATANTSRTQTISVPQARGVGVNDLPLGITGRTFAVVSGIKRIGGSGTGSIGLSFNIGNGSFSYTLIAPNNLNSVQRRAAKRGGYQFTYTFTSNGVTTQPASVTITVN